MPPNLQKSEPRKEDIMKRCMTLCSHPGMIALLCVLSIVQGDALWCKYCSERPEGFPSNAESSSRGILFGYCSELGELNKKCGSNSNQCVSATIKQECGKETDGDLASYFPRKSMTLDKLIKGCWDDNQTKNLQDMIIACGGKVDVKTCQGEDYCNADPLPPPIATEMIAVVVVIAVIVMILGFLTWGCWKHEKACFSKKGSMPISTDAEIDLSSSDD